MATFRVFPLSSGPILTRSYRTPEAMRTAVEADTSRVIRRGWTLHWIPQSDPDRWFLEVRNSRGTVQRPWCRGVLRNRRRSRR